jgi:hypothetical protein
MAEPIAMPNQYDEKYRLPNGNYDYDAYLKDYYAYLDNQQPDAVDPSKSNPRPQKGPRPATQEGTSSVGPGGSGGPTKVAKSQQAPIAPDPQPEAVTDADQGKGSSKDRPWWETDADASETATGATVGGDDSEMPEDWLGEVKNFRYADQKKLKEQYKTGTPDTEFRDSVHQARQNRHDTYAHGYDWADKDTPDDDHRSAANAAFFEDESWLDEVDQMEPAARKEYMRALQAADPESAAAILEDDRRRRQAA